MIKDNISYFNVDFMEKNQLGYRLCRYPEKIISNINEHARFMAKYSCGCEMRFVTESKRIFLTLHSEYGNGNIVVYNGDYVNSYHFIETGKTVTIMLEYPELFNKVNDEYFEGNSYSKNVWRVYFHNCICTVCNIDTLGFDVRVPQTSELPQKTILAYGSSITHGANAIVHVGAYATQLARLAGTQIMNKAVGGSCFLEECIADYFADEAEWDYALLELGVNITNISPEEFEKRCSYFVKRMAATGKQIFLITIFTNSGKYIPDAPSYKRALEFNEIIRQQGAKYENCMVAEGSSVLKNTEYLTVDGVHPSLEGHFMMGNNLYQILKDEF